MSNLDGAKAQAQGIVAAISGSSSAVQTLGSMGRDPHPERLLAVGLAHAHNSIDLLIDYVEGLEREVRQLRSTVDELSRKRR